MISGGHLHGGQFLLSQFSKVSQPLQFIFTDRARLVVDHTECSNAMGAHFQRATRVEANIWIAGHQGVVDKTLVSRRIGNDEDLIGEDGVGAERNFSGRLISQIAGAGFKPLAVFIDKRDLSDGHTEEPFCQAG